MTKARALFTKTFWLDAVERAAKTAAQFAIGGLGLGEITNAWTIDWQLGVGFAVTGAVLSLLTSVASIGMATPGTASMAPQARYSLPAVLEEVDGS